MIDNETYFMLYLNYLAYQRNLALLSSNNPLQGLDNQIIINSSQPSKLEDFNSELLNPRATGSSQSISSLVTLKEECEIGLSVSEKNFKCAFEGCGKSFDYRWILERHSHSHFCFKLFKCTYEKCEKAYKSKENLNLHIKNKHLGQKPYQCNFCTLRFSHRNGKTYHERKVHIHYLPHCCSKPDCSSSFASKSALNYHLANQH